MMLRSLCLFLMLTGCSSETSTDAKRVDGTSDTGRIVDTDTGHEDPGDDTGEADDTGGGEDSGLPEGPCADGTWGGITDPARSIHISSAHVALAEDWGVSTGGPGNPLTDPAELDVRLETDDSIIDVSAVAFWPGTYDVSPGTLTRAVGSGLRVEACSDDEVQMILTPLADHEGPLIAIDGHADGMSGVTVSLSNMSLSTDLAFPIIGLTDVGTASLSNLTLTGAGLSNLVIIDNASDVTLSGVSLTGGNHALSISNSVVGISGLSLVDSTIAGIWTTGPITSLTMDEVLVSNTSPGMGIVGPVGGWGIFLEGGTVRGTDITVSGSTGVAVFSDVDSLDLTNVNITDVAANFDGQLGRGMHLMDSDCTSAGSVRLTDVAVSGTDDTGVFIQRVASTIISGLEIADVGLADVPSPMGGGSAGDGLVITARDVDYAATLYSTVSFGARITDSLSIDTPERAAIIVDGANLSIDSDAEISDSLAASYAPAAFYQNAGSASGPFAFTDLGNGDSPYFPTGVGPLCLNLDTPSMSPSGLPEVTVALACLPFAD